MKNIVKLLIALLPVSSVDAQKILTLDDCIQAARTSNVSVRNAQNDLLMAREQQLYARSKRFPTVSASAFHFEATDYLIKKRLFSEEFEEALEELNKSAELGFDLTKIHALKSGSSLGLSVLQPVYTGGRLTNYNRLADLQVEARQSLIQLTDDQLVLQTQTLYYLLLKLHGKSRTLEAVNREVASIRQDAQNLADEGIVTQNDVLGVELLQDQLTSLQLRLDNGRRLLRRALAKHIGMPDEDIDIDTVVTTHIVPPTELWTDSKTAVDNRNESHLLDLNVERAKLETKIARAFYRPILAVGGNFGVSKFLTKANTRGIGFAFLSMPISTFWSERHEVKRKQIAEQKAIDFRQDKRELIDLQVRDAYDNLESAYRQIGIAEKSVRRADENLRANREMYINGVRTMSVLLDAQRQQQQAHDQYSDALCDYHQSMSQYLILTGRSDSSLIRKDKKK